ncbi:BREX-1 system adenine-specific DNA-methyltransferase PglX, partial [Leuconostoc lactis]|uniref:BREX-1 system adenine-specific DNA-methyltransferase PglX n=1 Tax=Leuconostoc lactis TaxID=1246 RepID=UPI001020E7B8
KDYVIGLPKSVKYDDVQIAHATQIFTPDWIVQYMVENSLGKYWVKTLLARGDERSEKEIAEEFGWKYYMIDADQSNEVQTKLIEIDGNLSSASVEDLKVIDPSMGSGHILVYAFDVLMNIYESEGYSNRDAAKLIIERNLYGLDIDKRAFQLSYFAIMMKYRQYSRRALTSGSKLNLFDIPSTKMYHVDNFDLLSDSVSENTLKDIKQLVTLFQSGDDIGSLLHIPSVNFENIINELDSVLTGQMSFEVIPLVEVIQNIVDVSQLLADKYQAVITNPPYMGSSRMNETLATFAKKEYPRAKSDLFAMFIERWHKSLTAGGYNAMVTMQSWMFLSSFEEMRVHLLNSYTISNLMHMENNVMGIAFGTAVTITRNMHIPEFKGTYHQIKTADASTTVPEKVPIDGNRFNRTNQANFEKIPGSPIAYWASQKVLDAFVSGHSLSDKGSANVGLSTADDARFLRLWYEVNLENTQFNATSSINAKHSYKKWVPLNKGGSNRKWYGNYDYLVNWEDDGYEIRHNVNSNGKVRSAVRNSSYYFKQAATWSEVTSGTFSMRFRTSGSIHNNKGMSYFAEYNDILTTIGLLNSPVGNHIFKMINPTVSLGVGDINRFPLLDIPFAETIKIAVQSLIDISKNDWDAFETSWDFDCHPLLSKIAEHNQKTPP